MSRSFFIVALLTPLGLPFFGAAGPETPSTTTPASPGKTKAEPRRDRVGDPLPPGAIARLGTIRFRAPEAITTLAFAPDGKSIAVSTRAGVYLFDAVSGKRTRRLPTTGTAWTDSEGLLVFSPDSKRLAGRGQLTDNRRWWGVVRVWDLAGEKLHDYDADKAVWVGWSPGGEPLAVCLEAGGLRLRELASGRSRRFACGDLEKPAQSGSVRCACSPDGQALVVADKQRIVHIWDTTNGRERCTIKPEGDYLQCLSLSPDGRILLTITRKTAQLWDAATGKVREMLTATDMYGAAAAFSPDGKTLALLNSSKSIRFWDVATGRPRGRTQNNNRFVLNFAFSPDGKTLATVGMYTGMIQLWDVATGRLKPQPVGHEASPHGTFAPDGRRVATAGGEDGRIHVWDTETGKPLALIQRRNWVRGIAFSSDGRSLYSTALYEGLRISDAATGERRHVLKLEDPDRPDTYQSAGGMRLTDDGKTLIVFSSYHRKENAGGPQDEAILITAWDTATRKQLFRRRRPGSGSWNIVSADGRVLAVPHEGSPSGPSGETLYGQGPMRLEDLATGERLLAFPARERQTWPTAFSPDGRLLTSTSWDLKPRSEWKHPLDQSQETLRVWETATAAEVLVLPTITNNYPTFSPDGRLLALAMPSLEILVWDLALGGEYRRFKGFDAEVRWLAFSPDGRRLISSLTDSTLLVWDVGLRRALPRAKLGGEGLAKAWADLGGADAPLAFRARWMLASAPEEAVALLKDQLRRAEAADAQRLRQLLDDLASPRFRVREKAQTSLEELGDLAVPALRQALTEKPTLEVRKRLQAMLERLHGPVTRPERLRSLRAVAVLEDIGTPAARKLLEGLAAGASEARLTREAKASLGRLNRR